MSKMTLNAWVSGRVQGVWFRKFTLEQAQLLGLNGWVRNLNDGRVEVLASGEKQALLKLEGWLAQGPPLAKVTEVSVEYSAFDPRYMDFEVAPNAS